MSPRKALFPSQLEGGCDLLQGKALPRSANLRMAEEIGIVFDVKQRMKDA